MPCCCRALKHRKCLFLDCQHAGLTCTPQHPGWPGQPPPALCPHLCEGREAVGGAGGVGHNVVLGRVVLLLVHAHHEHGRVCARHAPLALSVRWCSRLWNEFCLAQAVTSCRPSRHACFVIRWEQKQAPADGAEMMTFLAPPLMCASAWATQHHIMHIKRICP